MDPKELAELYHLPLELAETALDAIRAKRVLFLAVSGKIGAGKDTVAPRLAGALGFPNASHLSFAQPLRAEMDNVITLISTSSDRDEAVCRVATEMGAQRVEEVIDALWDEVRSGSVTSSYQRTPGTRRALQWWGTEVRRASDENYWVKKALMMAFERLVAGESVFVTDARFPNEASAVTNAGGSLVRLLVSEEEQARRILSRDGEAPKPEALSHLSETALDKYEFEHTIDTDKYGLDEVVDEAAKLLS